MFDLKPQQRALSLRPHHGIRIDDLTAVCQGIQCITGVTEKGSNRFDHERLEYPLFPTTDTPPSPPNHLHPVSHLPSPSFEPRLQNYPNNSLTQISDSQYSNPIANASSTAAHGLFHLIQDHEELTKREKAQRASHSGGDINGHFEGSLTENQVYRWDEKEYTKEGRCTCVFFIMALTDC
jgi:hypothetical protein